ncbi:MAG: sulfur carrier protein ThiS [Rikenellaceae bacterium]
MKVFLNQRELDVEIGATLCDLLVMHSIKSEGVALAVNNRIVKRDDWQIAELSEGDKITLIQATYGG